MDYKLCIGMPIYNEEICLRKALDSLLTQTYANFELVISDNASTDSTQEICREYLKKDKRIKYIRQESNIGIFANFEFVFNQCKCEYFMWAAADDYWLPEFLEKNIKILESNESVVGSISSVALYSRFENPKPDTINLDPLPTMRGRYDEKVNLCLKFMPGTAFYAIYRTKVLKESYIPDRFWAYEAAVILNVIKYGDFIVDDEILMYRYNGSRTTRLRTLIITLLQNNVSAFNTIFASTPFTIWCIQNLGWKICLKNIGPIAKLNARCEYAIVLEIIRGFKRRIFGQEKLW